MHGSILAVKCEYFEVRNIEDGNQFERSGTEAEFIVSRRLLKISSPKLCELVAEVEERGEELIKIPDVSPETFQHIVNYLFTQTIPDLRFTNAQDIVPIVDAADKFGLEELSHIACQGVFISVISAEMPPSSTSTNGTVALLDNSARRPHRPEEMPFLLLKTFVRTVAENESKKSIIDEKDANIRELEVKNSGLIKLLENRQQEKEFTKCKSRSPEGERPILSTNSQGDASSNMDEDSPIGDDPGDEEMDTMKSTTKLEHVGKKSFIRTRAKNFVRRTVMNKSGRNQSISYAKQSWSNFNMEAMALTEQQQDSSIFEPNCSCTITIRNSSTYHMYRRLYRLYNQSRALGSSPTNILSNKIYRFGIAGRHVVKGLICYKVEDFRFVVRYCIGERHTKDNFSIGFVPDFDSLKSKPNLYNDLKHADWVDLPDRKKIHCDVKNLSGMLTFGDLRVQAKLSDSQLHILISNV
ncbi:unnamed protein product [Allacma fusca]|uniref:BTB domain-containing protein n=1 Tax=Allacma fusca TaxID=39272 RepID=A0A8J2NS50_9HEXA|nr:unnamed protein product [Allacma fusca]